MGSNPAKTVDVSHGSVQPPPLYAHTPMDDSRKQIRVLTLLPAAKFEDDIQCDLHIVDAPDKARDTYGDYEALSYAWGNVSLTHRAWVGEQPLKITAVLDTAMRYLRHTNCSRLLWIDGVCINQADDVEKSHQVLMLRRIFSRARQVLVWLGSGDEETESVMRELSEVNHLLGPNPSSEAIGSAMGARWWPYPPHPVADSVLSKFRSIYSQSWWTRVWTLVELVVARPNPVFGYGRYWVPMFLLLRGPLTDRRLENACALADAEQRSSQSSHAAIRDELLDTLLRKACVSAATDPRDHVFAISGLFEEALPPWALPDYTLPVSVAYQRMTVLLLLLYGAEKYWTEDYAFTRGSERLGIPSWCIDFSTEYAKDTPQIRGRDLPRELMDARGPMYPMDLNYDIANGLLMLDGVLVNQIDHVERLPIVSGAPEAMNSYRRSWMLSSAHADTAILRKVLEPWLQAILRFRKTVFRRLAWQVGSEKARLVFCEGLFWKTLTRGQALKDLHMGLYSYFAQGAAREVEIAAQSDDQSALARTETIALRARDLLNASFIALDELEHAVVDALAAPNILQISSAAHLLKGLDQEALEALILIADDLAQAAVFMTPSGHFGRAPERVREGDQIVIFSRMIYPVVLRKQEEKEEEEKHELWKHVSFAYVQGIMHGEFVEDEKSLERRNFWLC